MKLLTVNEALQAMDTMINPKYKRMTNEGIKYFNTISQVLEYELNVNTTNAYIDIFHTKKSLMVNLKDKVTNKPVKKLYVNLDTTKDFTLAYDGLYYNKAWSKSGNDIIIDGLGWTIEQIRDYILEYEVSEAIQDNYDTLIDSIRKYFN